MAPGRLPQANWKTLKRSAVLALSETCWGMSHWYSCRPRMGSLGDRMVRVPPLLLTEAPDEAPAPAAAKASASGLWMMPRAAPLTVTVCRVPEMARPTVKTSLPSALASAVVATVKLCVSPAAPVK